MMQGRNISAIFFFFLTTASSLVTAFLTPLMMTIGAGAKTRIDDFDSKSTAGQVAARYAGNIAGKVVVVTGANSGIGKATLGALAKNGATVVMGCRNEESMRAAAAEARADCPGAEVYEFPLDVSSLDSVRQFAQLYQEKVGKPLDCLINNAGIMATPFELSVDGYEKQLATNHLGHFLLTNLLMEDLQKAAANAKSPNAVRIVNLASTAHQMAPKSQQGRTTLGDFNWKEESRYSRWGNYGMSKLANILHVKELQRRFEAGKVGITAIAVHPGVVNTPLFDNLPTFQRIGFTFFRPFLKTNQQGAATSIYAAFADDVTGGAYYSDCKITEPTRSAQNIELAQQLWEFSEKATDSSMVLEATTAAAPRQTAAAAVM